VQDFLLQLQAQCTVVQQCLRWHRASMLTCVRHVLGLSCGCQPPQGRHVRSACAAQICSLSWPHAPRLLPACAWQQAHGKERAAYQHSNMLNIIVGCWGFQSCARHNWACFVCCGSPVCCTSAYCLACDLGMQGSATKEQSMSKPWCKCQVLTVPLPAAWLPSSCPRHAASAAGKSPRPGPCMA
jgi:hypothetical protein